jgi:hypothetical protein
MRLVNSVFFCNFVENFNIMPQIYQYLGIVIKFWSNEHEPIHIHAEYKGSVMIVKLYVKNGVVTHVRYEPHIGKFPPAKINDLKTFVSANKNALLLAWIQYFENNIRFKPIIITRRIK